jgi:tRNA pseudouridine synthase 10
VNFVSSGREDADVRMLGEGRPFVLECIDPKNPFLSDADVAEAQELINRSACVQVHKLQLVSKLATKALMKNEAEKRKTYRCVIWCERALTQADMEHLSSLKDTVIKQRTPIRVFHR